MATILAFRPQARAPLSVVRSCAADVVLFPGVRYERAVDAKPAKKSSKKSKPRCRDILEPGA
ncbi:MAG: hypothetical protein ACKVP4_04550 [Hyphomicrobium sp.]